jgi:hypothetical protein
MNKNSFFSKSISVSKRFILAPSKDKLWMVLNYKIVTKLYQKWFNFSGKFEFVDRVKNYDKLLIVVAGYKDYLWEPVFKRIKKFLEKDIDVCIVSPGINDERLSEIAKKNAWSYLSTKENKLSLAQNVAIKLHPKAKLIYKLDEDIFVTKNFFTNLEKTLNKIKKEGIYSPGFIAPVINVNGLSYITFLKKIGKEKEYLKKFNELRSACMGVKAHYDPEAAVYLWENSFPLDEVAKKFFSKDGYELIPHRFSIGAIMFERSSCEDFGFFKVSYAGQLGVEEKALGEWTYLNNRPGVLALNALVGHFAFGPQNASMKEYFLKKKSRFLKIE